FYSARGVGALAEAARRSGVALAEGVYAGLSGPTYETPAEIRALRFLGADAVGMSTVIEARAAKRLGMEFAAISCIANPAAGVAPGAIDHADVLAAAKAAAAGMGRLFAAALPSL
ncbi:MAG TPA: purine-nucleoside phosphorylase, partial [Planctomycetia bacterium]|nr:purine-nucleoside phosphorylase [Planctomycetia bacterium]